MSCFKTSYDSMNKARIGARSATKKFKMQMYIYKCDECEKYHMSKMSRKIFKKQKKGKK